MREEPRSRDGSSMAAVQAATRTPPSASRRTALAGLTAAVGLFVAACSDTTPTSSPGRSTVPPEPSVVVEPSRSPESTGPAVEEPVAEPSPEVSQAAGLPVPSPWSPGPGEVQPEVKAVAARLLEVAGTWGQGQGGLEAAEARLAAAGFDPVLAAALSRLLEADRSAAVVDIIYPQYGGLTTVGASVMVALDQTLALSDGAPTRGMTLDVRLTPTSAGWVVTAVGPDQPPVGPGAPTALGQSVLGNPRLVLPADARADVMAGTVDDSVLSILEGLARDHTVDVLTLATGHPVNVFGTDGQSNHSRGRAVDVWRVDGSPVVDPATSRDLLAAVLTKAGQLGATEVGGPFDLNGGRPGYFTDDLHKDHLHLGVTAGRAPAAP